MAVDLDRWEVCARANGRYKIRIGHQRCCCDDDYRHSRQAPPPRQTVSSNAPSAAGCWTPQSIDEPAGAPSVTRATCGEKKSCGIVSHRCAAVLWLSPGASTALPRSRTYSAGFLRLPLQTIFQSLPSECLCFAAALRPSFAGMRLDLDPICTPLRRPIAVRERRLKYQRCIPTGCWSSI